MRPAATMAILLALLLLAGCALPSDNAESRRPEPKISASQKEKPSEQKNASEKEPPSQENEKQPLGDEEEREAQDEKEPLGKNVPEKEFAPRSISDRIYEGSFEAKEPFAEPLRMHFIDAGFADSILVEKGEFRILIDSGNGQKVDAYLQSLGISRIDILVATHDGPAAISGIAQIFDNYDVGELWESSPARPSEQHVVMLAKARAEKAAIKHPEAGDRMAFGGLEIFALNPPKGKGENNNPKVDAIILKIRNGDFCAVLLNPTVQEREPALISAAQQANESLRCDVATYFSHGEARAVPPSIIEHVKPKDVIISVGENDYGLPSPTTIRMLQDIQKRSVRLTSQGTWVLTNYGFKAYDLSLKK
ncbi:MAG: MBL fold metallo-hydrolase [Candidatus Micrarchaeota archaeon]|nr:MBL fold metallo-hydrolase [Candidatus Micrarchaeota archaeon]